MKFTRFGFSPEVQEGLDAMGFEEATPVQAESIPILMESNDLIACAQTGTGKTAAYLLPVLDKIQRAGNSASINTLIVAPTRELAQQIDQQLEGFAYFTGASSIAIYGGGTGQSFEHEKTALVEGADIIVATPGRLLSHLNLGYVNCTGLKHFILDEADRMLDMGFYEDIMKIAKNLPQRRQNIMFSATMPPKIRKLAKALMEQPKEVNIAISKTADGILQAAYMSHDNQKTALLEELIKGKEELQSIIVFTARKVNVNEIVKKLKKLKMDAEGISSDLAQDDREEVLRKFRNKRLRILVATDIISRGIDIESIDLVVNYDVPKDAEDYVHRVGRTARAKSTGVALTFISGNDQNDFYKIEQLIGKEISKLPLPEGFDEGPQYQPQTKNHNKRGRKKYYKRKHRPSKR